MASYAFFDFDGTLIAQDSFLILLQAGLKKQPWRIFFIILFSPILLSTQIFKFEKTLAKSLLLWSLTVFKSKKNAIHFLQKSICNKSNQIWFQEALAEFEKLKQQNVDIIIVSASGNTWIRALLRKKYKHIRLIIGSKLGFFLGGVILKSKNCYKEEKLKRIDEILGENFHWHSSWSDHIADLPLLKKAPLRYVICPRNKHKIIFDQEFNKNYILLKWTTGKL